MLRLLSILLVGLVLASAAVAADEVREGKVLLAKEGKITLQDKDGNSEVFAVAIDAKAVEVVGFRSSALLSNGKHLEELPYIAELRAKELELAIRMLDGLPEETTLTARWENAVLQGDGKDDWRRRKAEIRVSP